MQLAYSFGSVLDLGLGEDAPPELYRVEHPVAHRGHLLEPAGVLEARLRAIDVLKPLLLTDDLQVLFVEQLLDLVLRVGHGGLASGLRQGEDVLGHEAGHLVEDGNEVLVAGADLLVGLQAAVLQDPVQEGRPVDRLACAVEQTVGDEDGNVNLVRLLFGLRVLE